MGQREGERRVRYAYQDSNGKWAKFGCEALSKGCTIGYQHEKGNVQASERTLTVNGSLRRSICANALDRMEIRLQYS